MDSLDGATSALRQVAGGFPEPEFLRDARRFDPIELGYTEPVQLWKAG